MDNNQAQFLTNYLTGLWEGEFPITCRVLAAVPDGGREYRPDEKSRTAWELATHIATSDVWFLDCIIAGAFSFDAEKAKQAQARLKSVDDVVGFYKTTFPAKLAELRALPEDKLSATVSFFGMFEKPAVGFLGFANNHSMHHRGQLAAYLRAMGSKVPAIYGGSADEPMNG